MWCEFEYKGWCEVEYKGLISNIEIYAGSRTIKVYFDACYSTLYTFEANEKKILSCYSCKEISY